MRSTRTIRRAAIAATVVAGLAGGGLVAGATTFRASYTAPGGQDLGTGVPSPVFPTITPTCPANYAAVSPTTTCTVDLVAGVGAATVADPNAPGGSTTIPFWGFGVNGGAISLASPASAIKVPQGTVVTVNLTRQLPTTAGALALSFRSMAGVSASGSSYTFTAGKVGTSTYEAGDTPTGPRQVAMGLVGALVVTPPAQACASTMCAFDGAAYQDEALVAMTDLDAAFAADPINADMSYFGQSSAPDATAREVFHLINGQSFPDTDLIDVMRGDKVLLRYVNAGVKDKSLGLLGLHQDLLGRNADPYVHAQTVVAPLIGPGETADVAVTVPATTKIGMRFPLTDQSQRTSSQTLEGFGGAMTFLNVWGGAVPVAAVAAPTVADLKVNLPAGTLVVSAAATSPLTLQAVEYTVGAGAPQLVAGPFAAGPIASAVAGLVAGDVVSVRVQDSSNQWSAASTVTALAPPTVGALTSLSTGELSWTSTVSSPLIIASFEYSTDGGVTWTTLVATTSGAVTEFLTPAPVTGTSITLRATDSWGQVSATASTTTV